jgi:hypothetical protein
LSLERSRRKERRRSLLTTKARYRARAKLKEKTRKAQGVTPGFKKTTLDEALVDKEAEG